MNKTMNRTNITTKYVRHHVNVLGCFYFVLVLNNAFRTANLITDTAILGFRKAQSTAQTEDGEPVVQHQSNLASSKGTSTAHNNVEFSVNIVYYVVNSRLHRHRFLAAKDELEKTKKTVRKSFCCGYK